MNYLSDNYRFRKEIIDHSYLGVKDPLHITKPNNTNKLHIVSCSRIESVKRLDILIESLIYDGIKISDKYSSILELYNSNIPTDIEVMINDGEMAMILLRLVEIIGEDDLESLDSDTLYFITTILNQLNLDNIRNKILLKVLPLKI